MLIDPSSHDASIHWFVCWKCSYLRSFVCSCLRSFFCSFVRACVHSFVCSIVSLSFTALPSTLILCLIFSLSIMQMAIIAVGAVMKQQKRPHVKVAVNPYAIGT